MQTKEIANQSGSQSLPASTKNKLATISFQQYDQIGFRSVRDLVEKKDKTIRMQHILSHHPEPKKVIAETFVKSLDRVERFTGVKKWIDGEGVRYFMQFVLREYQYLTLADIHIFCNQIIEGEYGEAYENISVQKLIKWFKEYADARANKIYMMKRTQDAETETINSGEIDPDGLRKIAGAFGKVAEKHRIKELDKQPSYIKLSEYIERNGLDKQEFMEKLKNDFGSALEQKVSNGDYESFKTVDDISDAMIQSMWMVYKRDFLIEQNKKLKE